MMPPTNNAFVRLPGLDRPRAFIEHPHVQRGIIALILINAALLGLETWPAAMAAAGGLITGR